MKQKINRLKYKIYGIGTDLIEHDRVGEKVMKLNGFKERVFTPNEIRYCECKANKAENYAARFAAKEAFLKAIGTGWPDKIEFNEIEVAVDNFGKPKFILHGIALEFAKSKGIVNLHLSISHLKTIANAIVVLETCKSEECINIHSSFADIKNFSE